MKAIQIIVVLCALQMLGCECTPESNQLVEISRQLVIKTTGELMEIELPNWSFCSTIMQITIIVWALLVTWRHWRKSAFAKAVMQETMQSDSIVQTEPWVQRRWYKLDVDSLKALCVQKGICKYGLKADLVQRLVEDELLCTP